MRFSYLSFICIYFMCCDLVLAGSGRQPKRQKTRNQLPTIPERSPSPAKSPSKSPPKRNEQGTAGLKTTIDYVATQRAAARAASILQHQHSPSRSPPRSAAAEPNRHVYSFLDSPAEVRNQVAQHGIAAGQPMGPPPPVQQQSRPNHSPPRNVPARDPQMYHHISNFLPSSTQPQAQAGAQQQQRPSSPAPPRALNPFLATTNLNDGRSAQQQRDNPLDLSVLRPGWRPPAPPPEPIYYHPRIFLGPPEGLEERMRQARLNPGGGQKPFEEPKQQKRDFELAKRMNSLQKGVKSASPKEKQVEQGGKPAIPGHSLQGPNPPLWDDARRKLPGAAMQQSRDRSSSPSGIGGKASTKSSDAQKRAKEIKDIPQVPAPFPRADISSFAEERKFGSAPKFEGTIERLPDRLVFKSDLERERAERVRKEYMEGLLSLTNKETTPKASRKSPSIAKTALGVKPPLVDKRLTSYIPPSSSSGTRAKPRNMRQELRDVQTSLEQQRKRDKEWTTQRQEQQEAWNLVTDMVKKSKQNVDFSNEMRRLDEIRAKDTNLRRGPSALAGMSGKMSLLQQRPARSSSAEKRKADVGGMSGRLGGLKMPSPGRSRSPEQMQRTPSFEHLWSPGRGQTPALGIPVDDFFQGLSLPSSPLGSPARAGHSPIGDAASRTKARPGSPDRLSLDALNPQPPKPATNPFYTQPWQSSPHQLDPHLFSPPGSPMSLNALRPKKNRASSDNHNILYTNPWFEPLRPQESQASTPPPSPSLSRPTSPWKQGDTVHLMNQWNEWQGETSSRPPSPRPLSPPASPFRPGDHGLIANQFAEWAHPHG